MKRFVPKYSNCVILDHEESDRRDLIIDRLQQKSKKPFGMT
jgi:hypothetical protein